MFNLEQSIAEWRRQMLAAGIKTPVPLEELECHLREEIEKQVQSGASELQAFESAVWQMGATKQIKLEFIKLENWNRPLAWTAWGLFVVSFFLPAFSDGWGWQCAGLSAMALSWGWTDFSHPNWSAIWLFSLTLANLLMVVSPFLLARAGQKFCSLKWSRFLVLGAGILVWSYVGGMIVCDARDLKIGCYAWGLSFVLLGLSTLIVRSPKMLLLKNV